MSRSYREALGAERWNSTGGIPQSVKWRPLADRSCISFAPLRTIHEPILSKFVCRIFSWSGAERWNSTGGIPPVKWRPLMDRSCISVALLRTIHELILLKFVCRIF